MKNIFKKIIALSYLTIFLFSFFIPFQQTFADNTFSASITAEPSTIKSGDKTNITWTISGYTFCNITTTSNTGNADFGNYTSSGSSTPSLYETTNFSMSCTDFKDHSIKKWVDVTVNKWGATNTATPTTPSTPTPTSQTPAPITQLKCTSPEIPSADKTTCITPTETVYTPLAPLPGLESIDTQYNETTNPCPFGNYLNIMVKLIIGISAVLAMVMIVIGGLEYMTSELISSKEAGKERITHAILGLVITLGTYAILNTLNPALLNVCLKMPTANITITSLGGESSLPFKPIDKTILKNDFGITCDATGGKEAILPIGKLFIPQTEYSKEKRNTTDSKTIYVDCSSFVSQVYVCAGLGSPGNNSAEIFSTGNTTKIDGKTFDYSKINTGDLLGWKANENGEPDGHTMIYVKDGQVLDTQNTNSPTQIRPLTDKLKSRIKYYRYP